MEIEQEYTTSSSSPSSSSSCWPSEDVLAQFQAPGCQQVKAIPLTADSARKLLSGPMLGMMEHMCRANPENVENMQSYQAFQEYYHRINYPEHHAITDPESGNIKRKNQPSPLHIVSEEDEIKDEEEQETQETQEPVSKFPCHNKFT